MKEILINLFTVTFGFTFSFMLSTALKRVYGGVDLIYQVGIKSFIIRSGIIGLTFIISGIYFYHVYKYIKVMPISDKLLINYYEIIFIIYFAMGSWFSYHIARIIFHPFAKELIPWKSFLNNSDMIFSIIFIIIYFILFGSFNLICRIYKLS